jgi:uncharacterized protein YbaA (DUF1428 family)
MQPLRRPKEDTNMSKYVDGFVLPVPKKNRARYVRLARLAAKVWRDHGALEYRECIADDVPKGKLTSFPRGVKLKSTETVWFSFARLPEPQASRSGERQSHEGPAPRQIHESQGVPLDGKRVIFGGFKVVVDR